MRQQIAFVEKRDGSSAAHQYVLQTLRAYRGAAQFRNDANQRHFAHDRLYRRFFVVAICEIRDYLRTDHGCAPSDMMPEQSTDRSAPAPASAPEPTNPSGSGRRERPTPEGDDLDPTRYGDWEKNGRCIDF